MKERLAVPAQQLRRTWDPDGLGFGTTAELAEPEGLVEGLVGQETAVAALEFGLTIRSPGYNVYVAGPAGTGKTSYTCSLVGQFAAEQSPGSDWVYVHNFDRPDEPLAFELPPGEGAKLARTMEEFVTDAHLAAKRSLDTQDYHRQREELVRQTRASIAALVEELEQQARASGFAITNTERGLRPVPLLEGQPMTEEQFDALTPDQQRLISDRADQVQSAVAAVGRQSSEIEKAVQEELKELDSRTASAALAPVVGGIKEQYRKFPRIVRWLERVEQELVGHSLPSERSSRPLDEAAAAEMAAFGIKRRRVDPFARFRVNLFVDRQGSQGAPVIVETNPTYANLFGKAEFVTSGEQPNDGSVMHIKAGALHRANGGYLILQAADLVRHSHTWEALKRALSNHEARIEVPGLENRAVPVEVVRPEPIPLDVKVILIGSSGLYQMLHAYDEGFRKQFKLKAEFDVDMEASPDHVRGYARFVSRVCRRERLKHFTAGAVARVLEHSHRLAEDQVKLSARFNEAVEVIYEANAWATREDSQAVDAAHVERAIHEKWNRSALPERNLQEMIQRGTILVDVDGMVVGQVNGLTVMSLGDYRFGSPSRITAKVYTGQKGILHIEREIAMSGQIHDKGVLTLSAYLGDRFAQDKPLAFSASVAFEQTYVPVDGDSASSTELYALLSALSGVPIDQGIAVTGSVNQQGEVQPIGGVNEKIEGFFRVCRTLGLTGRQGVMIPRRNLPNLVLAPEVVNAVAGGQFHIWAVSTIEEGIEILTGRSAGERGANGRYTVGSLFDLVDRRIESLARQMRQWYGADFI